MSATVPLHDEPHLRDRLLVRGRRTRNIVGAVALGGAFMLGACSATQTRVVAVNRRPLENAIDASEPDDPLLPHAPESLDGGQRAALTQLLRSAETADTASIVVLHNGMTIVEHNLPGKADRLLPLSSITKLIVGMALGELVGDGLLTLDTPLSRFYPEWHEGPKSLTTLEQLLRHTAGVQRPANQKLLDGAPDWLAFARGLPLDHAPGTRFEYSNVGAELAGGIVQRASGMSLDAFVQQRLFAPLGIEHFRWLRDATGAPAGYGGLYLTARDLARVGELLRQGGVWRGTRILPEGWVTRMTSHLSQWGGSSYGMLTEVYAIDSERRPFAFGHGGDGRQWVFVAPQSGIVVVRMRDFPGDDPVRFDFRTMLGVADAFRAAAGE